jgi:acetyl/propionyl-CoA carboxylase alpha subunit
VVWGSDRTEAIARMRRALSEYEVSGIQTNLPFFRRVLDHPEFVAGHLDTGFIDRVLARGSLSAPAPSPEAERAAILAAALDTWRNGNIRPHTLMRETAWKAAGRDCLLDRWPLRASRNR